MLFVVIGESGRRVLGTAISALEGRRGLARMLEPDEGRV